jgi:hypothetical protein
MTNGEVDIAVTHIRSGRSRRTSKTHAIAGHAQACCVILLLEAYEDHTLSILDGVIYGIRGEFTDAEIDGTGKVLTNPQCVAINSDADERLCEPGLRCDVRSCSSDTNSL